MTDKPTNLIKSNQDIKILREGGRRLAQIFVYLEKFLKPGISLIELDKLACKKAKILGGQPSFLNYQNFPYGLCASVNDTIIHGLPSNYRLQSGDIIGLDFGLKYKNRFTDMARTFPIGDVSPLKLKLIEVTKQSLFSGIKAIKSGVSLGDVGRAIQQVVESNGFKVVRSFVGHGVGLAIHEEPKVPNYGQPGQGQKLETNMVLAVEPMVNAGSQHIKIASDGFSVKTIDGQASAHFEDTVVVTDNGCEVLTKL